MEPGVSVRSEIEASQPGDALLRAGGDAIEVVLHPRGEVEVHELLEVALEEVDHGEGEEGRDESGSPLEDVSAVDNRRQDRRVCRGPADPTLLARPNERRLGLPRRRP